MKKVCVVITSFKNAEMTLTAIKSVLCSSYPIAKIVVVDYGSSKLKDLLNELREHQKKFNNKNTPIELISLNRDLGVAEQHNIGFRECLKDSDYILVLDNDTEIEDDTVSKLVNKINNFKDVGILQPKIISAKDKKTLLEIGLKGNIFGIPKPIREKNVTPFFASGCGMLVNSKVIKEAGGYDKKFYLGVDDLDFSWRVRLLGYDIIPITESTIYHRAGITTKRISNRRLYFALRNTLRMLLKNYSFPLNLVISLIFLIRILEESLLFFLLYKLFSSYDKSVVSLAVSSNTKQELLSQTIRAIVWNIKELPDTIAWHKLVQKKRILSDRDVLCRLAVNDLIFFSESYG